jgi:hypothetical protein
MNQRLPLNGIENISELFEIGKQKAKSRKQKAARGSGSK